MEMWRPQPCARAQGRRSQLCFRPVFAGLQRMHGAISRGVPAEYMYVTDTVPVSGWMHLPRHAFIESRPPGADQGNFSLADSPPSRLPLQRHSANAEFCDSSHAVF